jgi:hypothetical protein
MRRRIDTEHNADLLLVDLHALDQRPNDLSPSEPIGFMQSGLDARGNLIEATENERQFSLQARFIFDLLDLCFHLFQSFTYACHAGFKLVFVDQSFRIPVDHPCHTLS